MTNHKGAVVITESMLTIGFTIIGIILLVMTFGIIFGSQSRNIEDTALSSIANELRVTLERVSASGSDVAKEFDFPNGISLNVTVSQKDLQVAYVNETGRRIKVSFANNLNTNKVYNFYGITKICILNLDKIIILIDAPCSCERLKREPCVA